MILVHPAVDRILVQVGAPAVVVIGGVNGGDVRRDPPEQVHHRSHGWGCVRRARHRCVRDACDGRRPRSAPRTASEGHEDVFEPPRTKRKTAVGARADGRSGKCRDCRSASAGPRRPPRPTRRNILAQRPKTDPRPRPRSRAPGRAMPADLGFIVEVVVMNLPAFRKRVAAHHHASRCWLLRFAGGFQGLRSIESSALRPPLKYSRGLA